MFLQLRRLYRVTLLLLHLLLGTGLALGVLLLPVAALRRRLPRLAAWWLSRGVAILGVKVLARGRPHPAPVLMLANHLSWLDILVLATQSESAYVAKAEVAKWPLMGWLAGVGGTEFVRRGSHADFTRVLARMRARLRAGQSLTLFPEGTSGGAVLPRRFRPRLLQAAVEAQVPVQPGAVYYGTQTRAVAFVRDDSLVTHVWSLLAQEPVVAEITFLPTLGTASGDCRLLADESWRAVTHALTRLELFEREAHLGPAGSPLLEPIRAV